MRIKSYRDFWAATLFAVVSLVFLWQSAGLAMGTAARMGPAYMPRALCGLMLVVAVILFIRSFRTGDGEAVELSLRPMIIIPGAIAIFALALHPLGLVISVILSVVVASFSDKESRPVEVALTAAFLSVLSVAVFAYGLGLNFPIWPGV